MLLISFKCIQSTILASLMSSNVVNFFTNHSLTIPYSNHIDIMIHAIIFQNNHQLLQNNIINALNNLKMVVFLVIFFNCL